MKRNLLLLTASLVLAATLPTRAALNYALAFDGLDDYVETSTAVIPASGDFTVECWAYVGQLPPWGGIEILSQGTAGNAFYLGSLSGFLRLGDGWQVTSVPFPTGGAWHHFAVVKSETDTLLYLDGRKVANLGVAIPNPAATPFRLGRQYGDHGEYWPGKIGDVRVWNRALKEAEVAADLIYPPAGTEPGLLSAWLFTEGAGDTCGAIGASPVNGTLKNGPTWFSFLLSRDVHDFGYALSFDGANDYLESGAAIIPAQGDFTVECWAFSPEGGARASRNMCVVSQGSSGDAFYIGFEGGGNTIRLGDTWVATGIPYPFGAWHYLALVKSSDRTLFYMDGVVRATNGPIANPTGATGFRVGRQYGGYGEYWLGRIDEVRVWHRALGEAEIWTGMHQRTWAGDALEVYWPFGEHFGSGLTVDASGHGHTGRLLNGLNRASGPGWRPKLRLNGAEVLTNECHSACTDPGATANISPVSIAAFNKTTLALKGEGTVVGWGDNDHGEANGWLAGSNVVAIATGRDHSLALKADGSVVGWGLNDYGQADGWQAKDIVVAIAAGDRHSLALKADGTVVGRGLNSYGQADGWRAGSNVIAIAASHFFSLALKADGTVIGWGYNDYGQTEGRRAGSNVVAIAGGVNHCLALKADGTVVGWGRDYCGETDGRHAGSNVVAIAAGDAYSLALKADGTLICWGSDSQIAPTAASGVVAMAAGFMFKVALKADGTIVAWGENHYHQCDVPGNAGSDVPVTATSGVDANAPGVYSVTYIASNDTGETTTATRQVAVVDTLPPVVALNGDDPLAVALGADWRDPGAIASDACSGDLTASILVSGEVNMNQPGTYTLHYAAADASGNVGFTNRTVLVQQAAPPVIYALSTACVSTNEAIGTLGVEFRASVNPSGSAASVMFQYGRAVTYLGTAARVELPQSLVFSNLTAPLDGLIPGVTYHWRLVASNAFGVSVTSDQELRVGPPIVGAGLPGDLNGNGVVEKGEGDAVLFSYLFSSGPTLTMANMFGLGGGRLVCTVPELPGVVLRTQVSTNLLDWQNLGPAVPCYEFIDTNAPSAPERFYRLSWP